MDDRLFLTTRPESRAAYLDAVHQAATALANALPNQPYSGKSPPQLAAELAGDLMAQRGWS